MDPPLDQDDLLSWLLFSDQLAFEGSGLPSTFTNSSPLDELDMKLQPILSEDDSNADDDDEFEAFDFGNKEINKSSTDVAAADSPDAPPERNQKKRSRPRSSKPSTTSTSGGKKQARDDVRYLEDKIKALQDENSALQAHVLNVTQRTTETQRNRLVMEKEMSEKLNSDDQNELAELCRKYSDIYSDYGLYRQKEVAFHLDQLEKLLVPTLVTKMSLWTLQQDNAFYQSSSSPLWDSISRALDISAEQTHVIQQGRQRIKALLGQLQESLNLVQQLKTAISKRHAFFDAQCGGVQQIGTPQQTVHFLLWMAANYKKINAAMPSDSKP